MKSRKQTNIPGLKLGILGGGQLGKMLINAASKWSINTLVLDPDPLCAASSVCNVFVKGDFKNYDDVYSFGKLADVITIEIENVNTDALIQLKKEGKTIFPEPGNLKIIKDKGLQKKLFDKYQFLSPAYSFYDNKESICKAIDKGKQKFPFVQKLRKAGYDGRGVAIINNKEDLNRLLEGQSLTEELIDIQKEISVIVARNISGDIAVYPPVEMTFKPSVNLVEQLICPAQIDSKIAKEAGELAISVINAFKLTGLLAVEMFLDRKNNLYINEVAPRPHNSGHQTIEGAYTSQYEQHLRAILGLPLGSTRLTSSSVMLNLLGEPGYSGIARYIGLQESMKIEGVNIHLYGKNETRPFRKMGHVTIIDDDIESAKTKARFIQQTLRIIS